MNATRRILYPVLCAALSAASAPVVMADDPSGRVFINPTIGRQYFASDRELEHADFRALGIEYRFTRNWAAELRYLDSNPDVRRSSEDLDLKQFFLDGLYYFGTNPRLEPYGAFGIGHAEFSANTSDSRETQINAGVGLRYHFTPRWSARFDARALHSLDDDHTDRLVNVSLSYAFGGTPAAAAPAEPGVVDSDGDGVPDHLDQCPNTPRGVAVDAVGCPLDSDGDGVPDYRDDCPNTPRGLQVDERGCPFTLTEEVSMTLRVNFAVNSAQVSDAFMGEIEKVAEFMRKYSGVSADIEGHTDSTGAAAYNQTLSQRRAEAVVNVLVERFGIDRNRLRAVGYGEERPIASNDTAEGRLANRRVVATMKAETEVPATR